MWMSARKVAMVAMVKRPVRTLWEAIAALVSTDLVEMGFDVMVSHFCIAIRKEKVFQRNK